MRNPEIGLCDQDISYIEGISERLEQCEKVHIQTMLFTGMQDVRRYLEQKTLGLLVTSDISVCEQNERGELSYRGVRCVALTEFREKQGIFKYQKVERICKEIRKRLQPDRESVRKTSNCYCVYSPLGRSGKTTLAKALAGSDEVRGGLYIGMEDFSGACVEEQHPDFLYKVKQRLPETIDDIVSHAAELDGTRLFQISGIYLDSRDVQRADVEWLKDEILASGRYTTVVFDIGSSAIEDFGILQVFDRVFLPELGDDISRRKLEFFSEMMKELGYGGLYQEMIPTRVPVTEYGSPKMMKYIWELMHKKER